MRFPVIIIGAGPAGTSAALALAAGNVKSLLIDQSSFPRDKVCGDALSGKVVLSLSRLNTAFPSELSQWNPALGSKGVIFVAPNGKPLKVPFGKAAIQDVDPGFIAKRIDFDNWMFEKASANKNVSTVTNVRIEKYRKEGDEWIISDKDGKHEYRSPLLLIADGAHSRFVRDIIKYKQQPEHFSAGLRCYYNNVSGLDNEGYIELHFLKDILPGYFWIFPLAGGRANVGLGLQSSVVAKRRLDLKKVLQQIITTHPSIAPRFQHAVAEGPVSGYGLPLGSVKRPLSGDGYCLLGDAGSLIDPFTGEGIGNAMISGLKAADVILSQHERTVWPAEILKQYDTAVYNRLWPELNLSRKMLGLVNYPWVFNFIANKAARSKTLRETISCMFDDIELRGRLKDPRFYLKVLFE